MKMYIKSVMVEDQQKALEFYTKTLGFKVKHNIPMGEHSWITLVEEGAPDGVELALEPNQYPAARKLQESLMEDGIPWTAFRVENIGQEVDRLETAGVHFTQPPMKAGDAQMAVFDDTCGNLIQLIELQS